MSYRRWLAPGVVVLSACCLPGTPPQTPQPVKDVLALVKQAYDDAGGIISRLPPLEDGRSIRITRAAITLQTKVASSAAGEFDILVVSASAGLDAARAQTITINFAEPAPAPKAFGFSQSAQAYSELVKAIYAAAEAARAAIDIGGPGALPLDSVVASIAFDVTSSASLSLKVPVSTLMLGPSAASASTASQKIELTFSAKKPGA